MDDAVSRLSPPLSSMRILYAARGVRGFGDGFAVIILPAYLSSVGFTTFQIGLIATIALLGSSLLTLTMGFVAPRHDLRNLLMLGAGLMTATGFAFPQFEHMAYVGLVAFVGTINPNTGDSGILVPLEHAMLARGVPDADRTRAFARYSLTGALASAAGALFAATPDLLVQAGVGRLIAFEAMFYLYAGLGIVGALLYRQLPHAQAEEAMPAAPLGPSRWTVYKLAALFSLDSFAGGFTVQSLMALWLFERFDLSLSAASLFFFWSSVFAAFSFPVAAWLSGRIGLINTMVFTHIPSSVFLIMAAFSTNVYVALSLLLVRSALAQMDVPARSSYVMAVVTPAERPAAASLTAVPKSLASAVSPAVAGLMLGTPYLGLPLIVCGVLKIVYDVALLASFRHIKPPEEQR
jgi:MFS family permease